MGFVREAFTGKNRFVIGISLLAALGGFLFGFDTGVVSGALPLINKSLHAGSSGEAWVAGSLLLGAVAGAVIAGGLADLISRKWTVFLAGVIYIVAALGSAFAPNLPLLYLCRFVLGIAVGTSSFVGPMYISEHAPKNLRGGLTALNQLAVTFGILIAYLVDDAFKNVGGNWRWMFGLGVVPGIALAAAMIFVPYTPRWLVEKGRTEEASAVLAKTRDKGEIDEEMEEIEKVVEGESSFGLRGLVSPRIRPLLLVGILLAVFQQVLGINTVIYYGATILGFAGLSTSSSIAQAVFIGVVNLVFAGVAVLMLDRVGRRPPLLIGTIGCVIGLVALGWYFHAGTSFQHHNAWIALVAMMFYIAAFEISLGPIFWVMIAEIFPLEVRSKAMAVATVFNWAFNFLVSYFFLRLVSAIGEDGTFWLYAGLGVVAVAYFYFQVPETKGRALEEIEQDIHGTQAASAGHPV
ncbi:MAG: sugar porter family transporter [Acidimicrobiaceae bacterium]|nr:sugar porter family transporter [Acidimicrobiaceae bacterium]